MAILSKNCILNKILPILSLSIFFGAFYYFTSPMIWLDIRNVREASLLWMDEGFHLQSIQRMQSKQTLELLHAAYTGFYSNISYFFSWLLSGFTEKIPTNLFILGSRLISYICIQVLILISFWRFLRLLGSWQWAFLGMCFVGMQRGSYFFSITMHPEPPMLLGIVISIFAATEYLRRSQFHFLALVCLGTALAIGSKLQALLLLPWVMILFLLGLWIWRITNFKIIFLWMIGSLASFLIGIMLFTPYQVFHWSRLVQGINHERKVQTYSGVNFFEWIEYAASNELIGNYYSILLLLSFYLFAHGMYKNRKNYREWLKEPLPSLYLVNLIWVLIGVGYVFVEVEVLIARYLIHVTPSLMIMTFLGVYWLANILSNKKKKTYTILLVILILIGIQQQTKHASFDFKVRQRIANRIVHIRQAMSDLKKIVPKDSHILNPRGQHLDSQWFKNINRENPNMKIFEKSRIEYLLIERDYLRNLKREGVSWDASGTEDIYKDEIKFINTLERDGHNGRFEVLREFHKASLTLYRKKF